MENIRFKKINNVHFIGIGGIGVSAIAKMFILDGKNVSGSDISDSIVTERLAKEEANIFIGHDEKNINKDTEIVIYTTAIREDNPELIKAKKLGIKTLSYPEALGILSNDKFTIAISGTHGKTTTTAMIAEIMLKSKLDPTVIIGSFLKDKESNFLAGKSKYLVCEACEYQRSFLNLSPNILVITNIDNDHLDYYKDIIDIQSAFLELTKKIPEDGILVCNKRDPLLLPIIRGAKYKIIDYKEIGGDIFLPIPGSHNIENAQAALSLTCALKISLLEARKILEHFPGTWRRFEFKGKTKKSALIYDDYAHHPTEIRKTLKAFREKFSDKEITVVFQPHLYSRTKILSKELTESFSNIDKVIILPIYAAREEIDHSINAKSLTEEIKKRCKNVLYINNFNETVDYLNENLNEDDVLITMGAGDVYKIGDDLKNRT